MASPFWISIIAIGIFLSAYATTKLIRVKVFRFFGLSALIKAIADALFAIGWAARLIGYRMIYVATFTIAGFLILGIAIMIFWGVHEEIYVEKTELAIIFPIILLVVGERQIPVSRTMTLMFGAFGTGLVFAASLFAIYGCYKLYTHRRGGAVIWALIGAYALLIMIANTTGLLLMFYETLEWLTVYEVLMIHSSLLILPDIIAGFMAYYYEKRIKPLLAQL